MSWKSLDWKFFVTIIATIAGVVIPIYLWQSDLSSHSLELRLRSTTALQPASDIQELQVFLNGKKLESPYLSSFELVNTGSKSILSSDFETPVELIAKGGLKVVSAQITDTNPSNIPVKVSFDEQRTSIAPFLSNPKDTITFSIITSGERPVFEHRARIAGVKEISFEDSSNRGMAYVQIALSLVSALLLLILNLVYLPAALARSKIVVPKWLGLLTGVSCLIGSTTAIGSGISLMESFSSPVRIGITVCIFVVGMVIARMMLNKILTRNA